jgi:hypothetical protein
MSRQRKTAAVLRLLRGEDLPVVSRSLGVIAATLTTWCDAFPAAGEAAVATSQQGERGTGFAVLAASSPGRAATGGPGRGSSG